MNRLPSPHADLGAACLGWAGLVAASLGVSAVAVAGPPDGFAAPAPCRGREDVVCIPLVLHLARSGETPACDAAWLDRQLREVGRHFSASGIAFEVVDWKELPAELGLVQVAADRDGLGEGRAETGRVDVFVVRHLADIDAEGVIRGVHWRHRGTGQRWIIVADYAPDVVLAHELGHWFGLPHSRAPASIMNKRPGADRPPPEERTFVAKERVRIARSLARQLRSRDLVPLVRLIDAGPPSEETDNGADDAGSPSGP